MTKKKPGSGRKKRCQANSTQWILDTVKADGAKLKSSGTPQVVEVSGRKAKRLNFQEADGKHVLLQVLHSNRCVDIVSAFYMDERRANEAKRILDSLRLD